MKLCITEKPSVAKDIAALLGADVKRDGYFEGNGYWVSWTYGHLCCLKEPHDYNEMWKRWSLGQLPMIPPRFGIKLLPGESYHRQFKVLETLCGQAESIINCGDAGQEGELIQRWVMQKARVKCPVERLWISSLTDESIREGFKHLAPQENYENLYFAGLSRAIGDWVLGLNATRLYTLKYSSPGNVLSVGRVQTPTLALVVARQEEIDNFVPKDTFELHTMYRGADFTSSANKSDNEENIKAMVEKTKSHPLTVTDVTKKETTETPPKLFDLTSLQVEANKKWGWTADQTLKHIQSLYEKKTTTYPRVDTTYLSEDIYPKIPDILRRMTPYASLTAPLLAGKINKSKKIFDNSKVTDHHAIIPTGESPTVLVGDEKKLYHIIAQRFIAAFYPRAKYDLTNVTAQVELPDEKPVVFKTSGRVMTDAGWRTVYGEKPGEAGLQQPRDSKQNIDKENEEKDAAAEEVMLPEFKAGESGPHKPKVVKKTSQPPKPYTEGTLLRAMESAGKNVDDEELREALKENGIGRPSTRSAIIEILFKRNYLVRRRKSIIPTEAGKTLIATIQEPLLKSAALTGIWENKLRRIERGQYQSAEFIAEIKEMITRITNSVLSDNTGARIR